jgi:23S rRNA-/tRNA-specific pseudouridylate synthase
VLGDLSEKEGEITAPLGPDIGNNPKQKVDLIDGKESKTKYMTVDTGSSAWNDACGIFPDTLLEPSTVNRTVVELHPETGR